MWCWQPAKPVHRPQAYSQCCPLLSDCLFCATVRVNETDTFADEDGLNDEYFDFEDISGTVAQLHATGLMCSSYHDGFSEVVYMLTVCVCNCRDLVNFLTNLLCSRCDQTMVCNFLLLYNTSPHPCCCSAHTSDFLVMPDSRCFVCEYSHTRHSLCVSKLYLLRGFVVASACTQSLKASWCMRNI